MSKEITINISGLSPAHHSALATQIESWCLARGFSSVQNCDAHNIFDEDEEWVHPEPADLTEAQIKITTSQLSRAGGIPRFGK